MRAALLAAALIVGAPATALEWAPIGGVSALGGLHSFDGARGSFSGNADASFAPAVRVTERWALVPHVRAAYEGTRRISDVLGAATASQERFDARFGARGIWSTPESPWRLKPSFSYGVELLKETKDEDWGKGLFDQKRSAVGLEAELAPDETRSLRASVDWFQALFPNYLSLESQAVSQFSGLSRELAADRALDRRGWQFSLGGERPLGRRLALDASASAVWSQFTRQRVVEESGLFAAQRRRDLLGSASAALRMPHQWNADLRLLAALELGVGFNSSSQNGYDAARGRFLPRFHDFLEWRAAPSATAIIGPPRRPVTASLRVGRRERRYPNRPAQDGSGAYTGAPLKTVEWTVGASLAYPMARRFSLLFSLERASASSNQAYASVYRYSYEALSGLAGFRWDW